MNREAWLHAVALRLWPLIEVHGAKRPPSWRVSCGWPSKSALRRASAKSRRIGEAWHAGSEDGTREVFISPALDNPVTVADVLLHELIHAGLPGDVGHRAPFSTIAKAAGLEGKPTSTYAGEQLAAELKTITSEVGRYPHARLDSEVRAKQSTRQMLVYCPSCECKIRMTRMWIDANGAPTCGCGTGMIVDAYEPAGEPLTMVSSHLEYTTADGRFTLATSRTARREGQWIVTDTQAEVVDERVHEKDGERVVLTDYAERWSIRSNRADALAFIEAIRDGSLSWDAVEEVEEDALDLDDLEEDELDDVLGEVGDWSDVEGDELEEDEPEAADFEDGELGEDEEDEYERLTAIREESGRKTSERIVAAAGAGAMD